MKYIFLCFLLLISLCAFSQDYYVVTAGNHMLSNEQTQIVTEVLSYNLYQASSAPVLLIEERDRRLNRWNMSDSYSKDLAESWQMIFPGAAVFVLKIEKTSLIKAELSLVIDNNWNALSSIDAQNFEDLLQKLPLLADAAVSLMSPVQVLDSSLYYNSITLRLRLDYPDQAVENTASQEAFVSLLTSSALESGAAIYFSDNMAGNSEQRFVKSLLNEKRPDHYYFGIVTKDELATVVCYNNQGDFLGAFPLDESSLEELALFVKSLALDQALIIGEYQAKYGLLRAINTLLAEEQSAKDRSYLTLWAKMTTSALAVLYQPMVNLFNASIDYEYYYSSLLGIGGGYSFSLAYPGMIDKKLATHPLVYVHDFNFYPVSVRTLGDLSFVLNLETGLRVHNSYLVTNHVSGVLEYSGYTQAFLLRIGPRIGMRYKLGPGFSLMINAFSIHYVIPLVLPEIIKPVNMISADLLGVGLSIAL